jgi:hydroxymethylbilane synthase
MSSPPTPLRIATRGSALALAQARMVQAQCQAAFPQQSFELAIIKTTGDKLQNVALTEGELPKGLFTKEIEEALLRHEADLAVHSLKDLPTQLPPGLTLGAVTQRADVRDALVYREMEHAHRYVDVSRPVRQDRRSYRPALSLQALPHRATVATGSTRRAAQLLDRRPDLRIVPIRGNVGTRLRKLAEQSELDATLLALAGLERLQLRIDERGFLIGKDLPPGLAATPLPLTEMLPCVGQGAIGIEMRLDDSRLTPVCQAVNHAPTYACVIAERAFLHALGGGCQLAVAAYAQLRGTELHLAGISFLDGRPRRGETRGPAQNAEELGRALAEKLA